MRATLIAAVMLLSGGIALVVPQSQGGGGQGSGGFVAAGSSSGNGGGGATSGGSSGNTSGGGGSSGASSSSGGGGSSGRSGGGHGMSGGHFVGAGAGPAARPGGGQGQFAGPRTGPHVGHGQPYSGGTAGRINPGMVRGQPVRPGIGSGIGIGRPSTSVRSGGPRSNRAFGPTQPRISRPTALLHESGSEKGGVLTTRDGNPHEGNWSRNDPKNKGRLAQQTQDRGRTFQGSKSSWAEACHRHTDHHRSHHGRDWWNNRCNTIILVDWGYWGCYDGWWYPAWGYDPSCSYYEYDGPIYGCNDLLPDEIVANVQSELQRLGYFPYEVDGVFGPLTQEALARYQRDAGIQVTGAIDPKTLASLGIC